MWSLNGDYGGALEGTVATYLSIASTEMVEAQSIGSSTGMSTAATASALESQTPEPAKARRVRLPESFSSFLHFLRIYATLAVFVGHLTRPDVLFDVDVSLIGRAAIPVFFMVSGFLTAMTFEAGGSFWNGVLRRYLNMYAIFLPAAVIILAMDLVIIAHDGDLTENYKFEVVMSAGQVWSEIFDILTFSGEYWSLSTIGQGAFSNQAMWTMDYIMAYTVMTCAFYLLTGWRRWAGLVIVALIAGPTVVLLSPLWIAGVMAYEAVKPDDAPRSGNCQKRYMPNLTRLPKVPLALAAGILTAGSFIALDGYGLGETLYESSKSLASFEWRQYLGMAKRFAWQLAYLPALFLLFVAARKLLTFDLKSKTFVKWMKMASRYCLPVYALHFSTIYFLQALTPGYMASAGSIHPYMVGIMTLLICVGFGWLSFRFIKPVSDRYVNRFLG